MPDQVRAAYGINDLSYDGAGQTIAIVDAYDDPTIQTDLAAFDSQFGLAAPPSFAVVNENGSTTGLPGTDPGTSTTGPGTWESEEVLDVEWAHAIAPGASIILVECDSGSNADMLAGVTFADSLSDPVNASKLGLPPVSIVSMSWGGVEGTSFSADDEMQDDEADFSTPGITYVAATGDNGARRISGLLA